MNQLATAAPPELRDFVDGVRRLCAAELGTAPRSRDEVVLPRTLWRRLGELGVLGLGGGEGEASWMLAVYRELGAALCPGPLVATAMAPLLLTDRSVLAAVRSGEAVVSVGAEGLFPWGADADVLISATETSFWLVSEAAATPRRRVETLGREPWARIDATGHAVSAHPLPAAAAATAIGHLAVAALLLGAASRLLDLAAEHARTRQQFGRAIGGFQGVAFPLAAGHVGLHNAGCLAQSAAEALDNRGATGGGADADGAAVQLCAGARAVASAAALEVARTAHQVHGAMGFTEESPVGAHSTRLRQWTLLPPLATTGEAALLDSIGVGTHTESEL